MTVKNFSHFSCRKTIFANIYKLILGNVTNLQYVFKLWILYCQMYYMLRKIIERTEKMNR